MKSKCIRCGGHGDVQVKEGDVSVYMCGSCARHFGVKS